jgi:hypothetical protein
MLDGGIIYITKVLINYIILKFTLETLTRTYHCEIPELVHKLKLQQLAKTQNQNGF